MIDGDENDQYNAEVDFAHILPMDDVFGPLAADLHVIPGARADIIIPPHLLALGVADTKRSELTHLLHRLNMRRGAH